jgi:hypothetical protein
MYAIEIFILLRYPLLVLVNGNVEQIRIVTDITQLLAGCSIVRGAFVLTIAWINTRFVGCLLTLVIFIPKLLLVITTWLCISGAVLLRSSLILQLCSAPHTYRRDTVFCKTLP